MSGAPGSRFWGVVTTLGLTGAALFFLFGVMEESRNMNNPTPAMAGVAAAVIFFALLRGPVGRAIGKMLEGQSVPDEQLTERIEQLEDRLAELSNDQRHVAELEERLDFAERVLAQRSDAGALRAPESQ
jgi:hypothetical protein